jgi:hypothetical protein
MYPCVLLIAAELTIGSSARNGDCITADMVCADADEASSADKSEAATKAVRAGRRALGKNVILHPLLT